MPIFWQDLKYGLRMLAKRPGFTIVAVITLALGIGANTAIFSVVNGVLLQPLPYPDPDRLTMVWMDNRRMGVRDDIASYPNYEDWRDRNRSFDHMAAYTGAAFNLTGLDEPERLRGAQVTANFFATLGVRPALGNLFTKENEVPGKDLVVVLSHGFWQRKYGGRADVAGQTIQLSGRSFTIIGVMPAGFHFPRDAELWKPLAPEDDLRTERRSFWLPVIGRLKPGIELSQAQAEMNTIAAALEKEYPANIGFGINLVPLHKQMVGETRTVLLVLLAAVGFVLLIACANVANLMLARAAGREREMAIRAALGAGRARLVLQMLTESVLLSAVSGVLGLLAAVWVTQLFISLAPAGLPRAEAIRVDAAVLAFTSVLALSTGVLFGFLPAVGASRNLGLSESLKETGRSSAGRARGRMRSALVVAEVSLSLVLLVGAGLAMQSFWRMQQVERGFDTSNTLTMMLSLAPQKYPQPEQVAAFYQALLERVRALPGVESTAATTDVFLEDLPNSASFNIEGRPQPPPEERYELPFDIVTHDYFETLRIPLVRGRTFTDHDRPGAPRAAVINETMVRRFFPNEDPLGKRFTFGDGGPASNWYTIVGVIRDVRRGNLRRPIRAETYFSAEQMRPRTLMLVVRTQRDPSQFTAAVRRQVREMDPEQPVFAVATLDQRLGEMVAEPRFSMILLASFAGLAMLLTAVGIYGVMATAVSHRTHEIGIRMALGASRGVVLRMVLQQGLLLAVAGVALGLTGALALTRLMSSLLFEVRATDPWTYAGVAALLVSVALLACYVPARRATRVDPIVALRYE